MSRGPEFSVRPIHVIEHWRYQLTSGKIYVTLASVRKSDRRYGNVYEGGKIYVTLASVRKSNRRYENVHEGKTPDMF